MTEKIKVGFFTPISGEWFNLHKNKIEQVTDINQAHYLIYESNGDPINVINALKSKFPKNKLVFILSGDQNSHIDDECIWFSNAVKSTGLAKRQTQIFVTNPAIYKFYDLYKNTIPDINERKINIYFKGTIWTGMRTNMYNFFNGKNGCNIIKNNGYWDWRFSMAKPSQQDIEQTAFESYKDMLDAKLCLCPKGNGNSSMRIVEAIACGAIPILIDDFSAPFGVDWSEMALIFDSRIHSWEHIWNMCQILLADKEKMLKMQKKGKEYFATVVNCDKLNPECGMYKDLNTVAYGFSGKIVDRLLELSG